ncbi:hypothetical protein Moror_10965 [Moniliophthora roreri MCA 2997]|uniref:Uncharacterized protein n=1 Tax=Moniliophthora roreri (strain MCA 2997) TaxID=1381753 RepID=V2X085_MONRO|nr:hypothetical protein Moror_10965 [Moniliophthora roreri MCA 2997]
MGYMSTLGCIMILPYFPVAAAATNTSNTSFDPATSTGECININECRTVTDILWSCLSVVLICTWVAIHPNIPHVETHPAVVVYQNLELMVIALLAPELIILWAMRQWISARDIAKEFGKYGWGKTHGFFLLMGGFTLYDGDKFRGYIWEEYERYDANRYLDEIMYYRKGLQKVFDDADSLPGDAKTQPKKPEESQLLPILDYLFIHGYITLTEDEIKGKSQGDIISKSIAIIQTTWFLLQTITRATQGLAITEIEIVTVAFALLNFGTFFLWWNKPLRVRHPVRVTWRQKEWDQDLANRIWSYGPPSLASVVHKGTVALVEYITEMDADTIPKLIMWLICLPFFIPWHIFGVGVEILGGNLLRLLPDVLFSTRLHRQPLLMYIAVYSVAGLFGVIHCVPWVFSEAFLFPTDVEQLLWRVSAVAVSAAPIGMGSIHWYAQARKGTSSNWVEKVVVGFAVVLGISYIVARLALLVLALTTLRNLPQSAYKTVQWTTYIPHIG